MERTWQGGCHCGAVRFEVTADIVQVTDCNCSVCTKKGFLHLIVAPEKFRLLKGADALVTIASTPAPPSTHFAGIAAFTAFIRRARIPIKWTSMCAASKGSIWRH